MHTHSHTQIHNNKNNKTQHDPTSKRVIVISLLSSSSSLLLLSLYENRLPGTTGAISTKAINKQNTQLFTRKTTLSFRVFCYQTHLPQFVVVSMYFCHGNIASTLPLRDEVTRFFALNIASLFLSATGEFFLALFVRTSMCCRKV